MNDFAVSRKILITLLLSFLLFSCPTVHAKDKFSTEQSFIGMWVSEKASQGGFKSILAFDKKGILIHRQAVMFDYRYKVDHNSITIVSIDKDSEEKVSKTGKIAVVNGKLELQFDTEEPKVMTRKDNWKIPADSKHIGHWSFKEPSGMSGYYIFDQNGLLRIRIPMPGMTVSMFTVTGNSIEVQQRPVKMKEKSLVIMDKIIEKDTMEWSINTDEILSLKDSSGKTITYKRFDE